MTRDELKQLTDVAVKGQKIAETAALALPTAITARGNDGASAGGYI